MAVSGGQQRGSAIHTQVSFSPRLPSHPGCHVALSRVPCALRAVHFKYSSVFSLCPYTAERGQESSLGPCYERTNPSTRPPPPRADHLERPHLPTPSRWVRDGDALVQLTTRFLWVRVWAQRAPPARVSQGSGLGAAQPVHLWSLGASSKLS